jgi:hypothetical protein
LIRGLTLALAAAAAAATPAQAKPDKASPPPMSADDAEAVQTAVNRAQSLYTYDQAAWHTTDALLAAVPEATLETIRGWVVTPEGESYRVTYYSGDAGSPHRAVFSAVWNGGTKVADGKLRAEGDDQLSAEEARLAAASDAVSSNGKLQCAARPFNRVILPHAGTGGADLVYLLTPQTQTGSIPLGGHYRAEVKDGRVVAERAFTNACLELPVDERAEALVVSHLLDPTPTEIHFFSVFAARRPIFVVTAMNERIWAAEVSGGEARMRLVK